MESTLSSWTDGRTHLMLQTVPAGPIPRRRFGRYPVAYGVDPKSAHGRRENILGR